MAKKRSTRTKSNPEVPERRISKSLIIAQEGIYTGQQFSACMSALMGDILSGAVTPGIGNATCNAGGKLLKMVELNMKYGQPHVDNGMKSLQLVANDPVTA